MDETEKKKRLVVRSLPLISQELEEGKKHRFFHIRSSPLPSVSFFSRHHLLLFVKK